jgi:lipopolysaccharide/colanic/teichoic acid biosynthesis glycosyltransferase
VSPVQHCRPFVTGGVATVDEALPGVRFGAGLPHPATPWKRMLDVTLTIPLAIGALPILAVAAIAIKATGGGPIVFWQRRVGCGGREFWFPKLRSMIVGAEDLQSKLVSFNMHGEGITFKMKNDPRVTRVGRILRTLSIDELPQLWCIIKGDMSLVGPRPPLPNEVARYTATERRRLEVAPGLTGLWQVKGRSTIPFEGQVHLDLQYIERRGLAIDLKILAQTVRAVLSCKGAW